MSESPSKNSARPAPKAKLITGVLAVLAILLVVVFAAKPFSGSDSAATQQTDDPYALSFDGQDFNGSGATQAVKTESVARRDSEEKYSSPCASCAKKQKVAALPAASATTEIADGAPSNAEVEKLAKAQKNQFASGEKVELGKNGEAKPPVGAPDAVRNVIAAGNQIAKFPYIWGGGHGSFQASGYDCSGSVSYALKGANLVETPMVSGAFEKWGEPGPGKWITVYAKASHMYMVVGGLRFDTSFRDGPYGSRWQTAERPSSGFVVRHPAGL